MSALAIFSCRPNSHPFQERHVSVHEPIKIGRSVARARPAQNNAIFDCKVLSRNHALLWYENGKFYLQDTKSSNGTFINNQRLSKGSEESPPREIYSGDIVQFGVDVMENSRRVTHGCIIASITLYHPDGAEAKPDMLSPFLNAPASGASIQSQELYQLTQCLQEALHREQMLENKLATLQRLVQSTQEASDTGWQAFIDEDRLLSRLEVLENQLQAYSKNQTDDTLRQEIVALQEDKLKYETTAKESLRRVLQEKLDAVRKLSELERSLSNTEDECSHLKEMCEMSQKELQDLAEKYETKLEEVASLTEKLQEAEKNHKEKMEQLDKDKVELEARIEEMNQEEDKLNAKVESLQADSDFTKEQLVNMKGILVCVDKRISNCHTTQIVHRLQAPSDNIIAGIVRMESYKESNSDSDLTKTEELGIQVDIELIEQVALDNQQDGGVSDDPDIEHETLKRPDKLREAQKQIEEYKAQIKESEDRLQESKEKIENLQSELEQAQAEAAANVTKMTALEEKLKLSDMHMNQMVENTVSDLKLQFMESQKQAESSNQLVLTLKDQISKLERQLSDAREVSQEALQSSDHENNSPVISSTVNHVETLALSNNYRQEIERLQELLNEARRDQNIQEAQSKKFRGDLDIAENSLKKLTEEVVQLRSQLDRSQQQAKDSHNQVYTLQDQLNKAENSTKEVKDQILALRGQLEEEKHSHEQHCRQLEDVQLQMLSLQEELENEKESLRTPTGDLEMSLSPTRTEHLGHISSHTADFASLKEECAGLRKRIQDVEIEMKRSRSENIALQQEYSKLEKSYKELEALKVGLENRQTASLDNLTDAQKEADQTSAQLVESYHEIKRLKAECTSSREEVDNLRDELGGMTEEFQLLSYRTKTLSTCAMLPLLMLLFAILLAMSPFLASITATTSPT